MTNEIEALLGTREGFTPDACKPSLIALLTSAVDRYLLWEVEEHAQVQPLQLVDALAENDKRYLAHLKDFLRCVRENPPQFGQDGRAIGSAVGGVALGRVGLGPVGVAVGGFVGEKVGGLFGDEVDAEFASPASFEDDRAARNLALLYQAEGVGAFVYYDASKDRWIVKHGQPTPMERELLGKATTVDPPTPGQKSKFSVQKGMLVIFPPAKVQYGADFEAARPTLLDAIVYGGIPFMGAQEKDLCTCAELPSGKLSCTRPGVLGILSQSQVRTACLDPLQFTANGRVERAGRLAQAQGECSSQMIAAGLAERKPSGKLRFNDVGAAFAYRAECLKNLLSAA